MKKLLLTFFACISLNTFAQITLEHVHIIATGRQYTEAKDNFFRPIPASGANKTWDYSMLKPNQLDSIRFGMPFWYKGHTHFPGSNYALINSGDTSAVSFATLSTSSFTVDGSFSSSDTSQQIFKLKMKYFEFPSTYNHQFSEDLILPGLSLGIGIDPDTAGPLPKIDSLQISTSIKRNVIIDGWGSLKTPIGTFNVLKQNTLSITSQVVMVFVNGAWIKANNSIINYFGLVLPQPDSTHSVNFMTNSGGIGVPLVSCSYHPKDSVSNEFTWLYALPRKSNVASIFKNNISIYPNPSNDILTIEMPGTHQFSISNVLGQLMFEGIVNEKETVETAKLTKGIYFLKIFDHSHQLIHSERIVVN